MTIRVVWALILLSVSTGPLRAQVETTSQPTIANDSLLFARAFLETFKLAGGDSARAEPAVLCLATGGMNGSDAPPSVLRLLATHRPPVRPVSACHGGPADRSRRAIEAATCRPAWILSITLPEPMRGDTINVHSSFYVAPLWAAGWVCRAVHSDDDWHIVACTMAWIS
jgi:hypothetical protein